MKGKGRQTASKATGGDMSEAGAVLYIRVSTDEQARHGVSLDAQEERLRAYCTMRELPIVGVIRDEGVSAFKHLDRRPGGAELLQAIAQGKGQPARKGQEPESRSAKPRQGNRPPRQGQPRQGERANGESRPGAARSGKPAHHKPAAKTAST